jgi:hypothetical protein
MRVRVGGQINPSKSKLKQAKKLAFPWISLADSGLFNGLLRIQIKIFSPFDDAAARPLSADLVGFRDFETLAQIPFFVKK